MVIASFKIINVLFIYTNENTIRSLFFQNILFITQLSLNHNFLYKSFDITIYNNNYGSFIHHQYVMIHEHDQFYEQQFDQLSNQQDDLFGLYLVYPCVVGYHHHLDGLQGSLLHL